jgi:hypothetical protein
MLDPQQKFTGTRYTTVIALVAAAAFFSTAVLFLSGLSGQASVSLALAFSGVCLALAWFNWSNYSRLTIPSLEPPPWRSK